MRNTKANRILFFGGFSCPPQLYKKLVDEFYKHAENSEIEIKIEFVDWMNGKEESIFIDDSEKVIVVCHSMGCQVGLDFYSKHKNNVVSIVMFDDHPFTHSFPDPPKKGLGLSFFPEGAHNSPEVIKEVTSVMSPDKYKELTGKFANINVVPTVPTLLVMATGLQHVNGKLIHTCIDPKNPYMPIPASDIINYKFIEKANHFWFMEDLPEYSKDITNVWGWIAKATF